ncbi:Alpha/Beta hydrolase protein [Hysterangium stoloniferum]|nr:Alpha/Beta hydrolase protein [Hysterangium stoloniferum]
MLLFTSLLSSVVFGLSISSTIATSQEPLALNPSCNTFDPRAYPMSAARCTALNRATSESTTIALEYVNVNPSANRTLLLVHGWPSLWSTWSNQIKHFEKDYNLIVPNLRGFGGSTHPGDVQSSGTMADMVSDLTCVLEHASVQHKVVCVGHDWGAQVCWEAARMRPDLFEAVAGAVLPYLAAAGPLIPVENLSVLFPGLTYNIFFEKRTNEAAAELDTSIRRSLRAALRSASSPPPPAFLTSSTSFLDAWSDFEEIPPVPFMSPEEEDYMVEQYSMQGFGKTLQFYTHGNRLGSWSFDRAQGNFSIPQPALYIMPTNDPVADWEKILVLAGSPSFFSQLRIEPMDTHHWPQLEDPHVFNLILQDWLNHLPSNSV